MNRSGRKLVYSVTKTFLAVLCLRLELELDAPVSTWIDDARVPPVTLRRLLDHTSGIPDYGRLPEYAAAVRDSPSQPWDDEKLLARALAQSLDFQPGTGWAYSNTGYLLVRRIVDAVADGGFAGALERELLGPLELTETSLALELDDLADLVPACSDQLGDVPRDVRGLYHPCWVGHRTLASTVRDQVRFWTALAAGELCDLAELSRPVAVGFEAPGFVQPSYGLGVLTDPGRVDGLLTGHGGGGPGYTAGAFALVPASGQPRVAVVLSADERADAQGAALALLGQAE